MFRVRSARILSRFLFHFTTSDLLTRLCSATFSQIFLVFSSLNESRSSRVLILKSIVYDFRRSLPFCCQMCGDQRWYSGFLCCLQSSQALDPNLIPVCPVPMQSKCYHCYCLWVLQQLDCSVLQCFLTNCSWLDAWSEDSLQTLHLTGLSASWTVLRRAAVTSNRLPLFVSTSVLKPKANNVWFIFFEWDLSQKEAHKRSAKVKRRKSTCHVHVKAVIVSLPVKVQRLQTKIQAGTTFAILGQLVELFTGSPS